MGPRPEFTQPSCGYGLFIFSCGGCAQASVVTVPRLPQSTQAKLIGPSGMFLLPSCCSSLGSKDQGHLSEPFSVMSGGDRKSPGNVSPRARRWVWIWGSVVRMSMTRAGKIGSERPGGAGSTCPGVLSVKALVCKINISLWVRKEEDGG